MEREIDRQIADLDARLQSMGMPLDRYLEYTDTTVEKLRGERREGAVQRLRLELALDALAEAEGIEVDEAAVVREEQRLAEGRKLTAQQRRRLHQGTHVDLARRGAGERSGDRSRRRRCEGTASSGPQRCHSHMNSLTPGNGPRVTAVPTQPCGGVPLLRPHPTRRPDGGCTLVEPDDPLAACPRGAGRRARHLGGRRPPRHRAAGGARPRRRPAGGRAPSPPRRCCSD